jgi:hypothetical protein
MKHIKDAKREKVYMKQIIKLERLIPLKLGSADQPQSHGPDHLAPS